MRLNFNEGEDFPNQAFLWEANQQRSLKGKKGQAALRELEAALLSLPEKKLIKDELENADGQVCALGALAKHRGVQIPRIDWGSEEYSEFDEDDSERMSLELAKNLGVPKMVAVAVVYENDDCWPPTITPEGRYTKMLGWVRRQLKQKES
jgi:sugar phosphate isomerase/epimerase